MRQILPFTALSKRIQPYQATNKGLGAFCLFIIVSLLTAFLLAGCENGATGNVGASEPVKTDVFVPVTNITGVKTTVVVGTVSLSGTVVPSNATNKTIRWFLLSDEDTEATIDGNKLTTKAKGTVVVRAIIYDGIADGVRYIKNFTITVDPFVPVTSITSSFSSSSKVGELYLDGTVKPADATYTDILWSIKDRGTTNAIIRGGDTITTYDAGTLWVTATVTNGTAEGKDYTQDFKIDISKTTN